MLIYVWDGSTKEFLRAQEAQRNPKRPTEYLMPANSTTEQVPDIVENQVIVWGGEHWTIKPDYRGQLAVNKDGLFLIVTEIGELPEGYVHCTREQERLIYEKGFNYFIIQNGKLVPNPNYEKEEAEKEAHRIAMLNMTKYDFFKLICRPNNITYVQLMEFVNSNDEIAAAWNLCERVYRGDALLIAGIKQVIPSMTDEELTRIFEGVKYDN